jgi:hypothetical protein
MAMADASGPLRRPLIDGIVAVNGGIAVESTDAVNHGLFQPER